jgi:uncharacterized protein involved in exopolysaccharide biosynthesis
MTQNTAPKGFVYNTFDLIRFCWDKKWILISCSVLAFILSVIVALKITPRYRSQVVLYPVASVSLSRNLVETSSISMDSRDVLSFGGEQDAERMLQILHSNQIRDHIVNKFDLINHYEIDTASPYPMTKLEYKYKSNIRFRRTEFMSLEISVLDTDPRYAADIANEIASYVDSTVYQMQRERALEAFNIVEQEYLASQQEINRISDSLQVIRKLGVIDYESQASALSSAYTNALAQGNKVAAEALQARLNTLSKYGGAYLELTDKLNLEIERFGQLKVKYAAYKLYIDRTIPQIFIVDRAAVAERKAVPRRSMIVLVSTLATFAMTLLVLLVIDNLKTAGRNEMVAG